MFFPGSRYLNFPSSQASGTYQVTGPGGTTTNVTRLPLPNPRPLAGWYQTIENDRLDLIAYRFLNDPTVFWILCDSNGSMVPDALASHPLVGIPTQGATH